jgi:putative membrane protein
MSRGQGSKLVGWGMTGALALGAALAGAACQTETARERERRTTTATEPAVAPVERRPVGQQPATEPALPPGGTPASRDGDAAKTLAALHQANQREVALAGLAQKRSTDRMVKQFATMIVREHKAADAQVLAAAKRKNVVLTTEEARKAASKDDDDEKETMDKLTALRGPEFDREFAQVMVDEHEDAVKLVKDARDDIDDVDLKSMLAELQGKLEKHHEHAKHLVDMIKNPEERARQGRRPVR